MVLLIALRECRTALANINPDVRVEVIKSLSDFLIFDARFLLNEKFRSIKAIRASSSQHFVQNSFDSHFRLTSEQLFSLLTELRDKLLRTTKVDQNVFDIFHREHCRDGKIS